MKAPSFSLPVAAAVVLAVAIVSVSTAAQPPVKEQSPQADQSQKPGSPPSDGVAHPARQFPAPTNLKVLPKDLSGKQVRDIMEGWAGALGVHCDTCHTADPGKKGPNGRPVLKFADDSKPEKNAARLMVKMTTDINDNYVSMVDMGDEHEHEDHADHKVTCGTCHRGHLKPEAFVPPPEHGHPHPPAPPAHPGA